MWMGHTGMVSGVLGGWGSGTFRHGGPGLAARLGRPVVMYRDVRPSLLMWSGLWGIRMGLWGIRMGLWCTWLGPRCPVVGGAGIRG